MRFVKAGLSCVGAGALFFGMAGALPAFATSSFTATIELACAQVGDTQTITVNSAGGTLVHIEVNINGSTANGGTQHGTGVSSGVFTDQWVIASVPATTATVKIWAITSDGVAEGNGEFTINPAGSACPSPHTNPVNGDLIDVTQVQNQVKKTCDAGLSGRATFTATIAVKVTGDTALSTTITLPADATLTLDCNGAAKALPFLPLTSVVTLHEVSAPTGAVAAADTHITIAFTEGGATTIHNAKAAATATPTPTPTPTTRTLAQTGGGQPSEPSVPWPLLLGLILTAGVAARLIYRRN